MSTVAAVGALQFAQCGGSCAAGSFLHSLNYPAAEVHGFSASGEVQEQVATMPGR